MTATFAMYDGINRIRKCHYFDEISSLAALEVVTLTTSGTASDENFIKMMIFPFQYSQTLRI